MSLFSNLFKKKESPQIVERNCLNIQVNDIVTYELEDYMVVSKLVYNDYGYEWTAYLLDSAGKTIWLCAEMDDELELAIYRSTEQKLSTSIPKKLEVDGKVYYLEESGEARVRGEGRGSNVDGQVMQYYDFEDEDGESYLSVEIWGNDEVEVSRGYSIKEYDIEIMAGS